MTQVQNDDELRRLYRTHARAVFAFFTYRAPREIAEDLTSSTFERVVRHWGRFDASRGSEKTWIFAIARNVIIDYYRREQHHVTVSTDQHPGLLDRLTTSESLSDRHVQAEGIREWLAQLDERECMLVALRYGGDLSTAEVAQATGLSLANVQQILSRCLRRLRANAMLNDNDERTARR